MRADSKHKLWKESKVKHQLMDLKVHAAKSKRPGSEKVHMKQTLN